MADIDRLKNVQPEILDRLYVAVEENLRDLEDAMRTGRLSTVAWLTQNILELVVWSDYCMQSEVGVFIQHEYRTVRRGALELEG